MENYIEWMKCFGLMGMVWSSVGLMWGTLSSDFFTATSTLFLFTMPNLFGSGKYLNLGSKKVTF
jgi:hypothetical protein